MPIFTKPQFNNVWAATGVKLQPIDAKISQGWIVEIPPYEQMNWIQNRQDAMLAHVNQAGIPVWDDSTEYQAGKSYVQGASSGVVYRALKTHTNRAPETDMTESWAVAFEATGNALLKSQNLADVPDKALARNNLGISTTAEYDARYNIKAQNLADVPNKATARTNLDIFSKSEVQALIDLITPAGTVEFFATATAPTGWLVCDGSAVSRTTYARLFAAIGTRYGAGNGTSTFNLPEARGEFLRGWDGGRGIDVGRNLGSSQSFAIQSHTHPVVDNGHAHGIYIPAKPNTIGGGPWAMTDGSSPITAYHYQSTELAPTNVTIAATGIAETRPRNIAFLVCIRT